MPNDHFYTLDPRGELAPQVGYEREGTTGFVYQAQVGGTSPLYRWFHPGTGDHFYTTDPGGELAPQVGYIPEGVACFIFTAQVANSVALFRWFNPQSGDHFYTTDPNGELAPQNGYDAEGVACYLYPNQLAGTVPLFRWYHSGFMSNFTFDSNITAQQQATLYERHSLAYFQSAQCGSLSAQEIADVRAKYRTAIQHSVSTDPNANASAIVGGSRIWINFTNLFPLGDNEIAQTLVHEMMHCASYTHPVRRDPPLPNPDVPGDNGPYYGTPPLQAELCIAGQQSDAGTVALMLAPRSPMKKACPVVQWTADLARTMTRE
jgi:hypothetical protein